jgi:hypothetical protein
LNFVLSSSAREAREYWYAADGRAMLRYRGAAETYHGWDYSDHGQEVIYGRGGLKCAQALAGYLSPYAVGTLCGNPISLGSF